MGAAIHTDPEALAALVAQFSASAAEHDRAGSFPFDNFARLHAAGLIGLPVSRRFGGGGAGLAETSRVIRTLARGDASTALVLAMHYIQHGAQYRARVWPRAAYEPVAVDAVEHGGLINALQAEPAQGALGRGGLPLTLVEPVADGFRLQGRKTAATGIPILRWLSVWGRTLEATPRVGTWLVARDTPGIEVIETWDHMGMRASGSHDVVLHDVVTPQAYLLGAAPADQAIHKPPAAAAWTAVLLSAVYLGVAEAARDWLAAWLQGRTPASLGRPLSTLERFQDEVGAIQALIYAADRVLTGAAAEADADPERPGVVESGLVKVTVVRNAIRVVERAMALTGNPGLTRANPLERNLRDVLCGRVNWPHEDASLRSAGRAALMTGG